MMTAGITEAELVELRVHLRGRGANEPTDTRQCLDHFRVVEH
jgi:hypothetical protein